MWRSVHWIKKFRKTDLFYALAIWKKIMYTYVLCMIHLHHHNGGSPGNMRNSLHIFSRRIGIQAGLSHTTHSVNRRYQIPAVTGRCVHQWTFQCGSPTESKVHIEERHRGGRDLIVHNDQCLTTADIAIISDARTCAWEKNNPGKHAAARKNQP